MKSEPAPDLLLTRCSIAEENDERKGMKLKGKQKQRGRRRG